MFKSIPEDLLDNNYREDDINILIGENGSGKSTLLNDVLQISINQDKNVIAIANTIHDKFKSRGRYGGHILKSNRGRSIVRNILFSSFYNFSFREIVHYRNISNILEYVSYKPRIGFKIDFVIKNLRNQEVLRLLDREEQQVFNFILDRYHGYRTDIIWIDFSQKDFYDVVDSYFLQIFKFYKKFKQISLIREINYFLEKDSQILPLYGASSGELTVISSLIFISSVIKENSTILIDEPENSLHPKWQIEYTRKMLELFYRHTPKIIIATHSPIIISSSESNFPTTKTYKSYNGVFTLQKKDPLNIEEIFFRYFDVTTPENRFLSEHLIRYLNLLSNDKINLENFDNIINKIINDSYDIRQIEVLEEMKELGKQIIQQNN